MPRHNLAFAALALALACSDSSSSDLLTPSSNSSSSSGGSSGTLSSSGTASSSGAASSSGGSSSGSSGMVVDAGTDSAPQGRGAFLGAPAYTACTPALQQSVNARAHNFNNGNPAGRACMNCHGTGGTFKMAFGGTVYKDAAGTMPVGQGYEVRLRDSSGQAISACTDRAGNFYEIPEINPKFPVETGVRDGTNVALMSGTISNGNCNSTGCHSGTAAGTARIHVP